MLAERPEALNLATRDLLALLWRLKPTIEFWKDETFSWVLLDALTMGFHIMDFEPLDRSLTKWLDHENSNQFLSRALLTLREGTQYPRHTIPHGRGLEMARLLSFNLYHALYLRKTLADYLSGEVTLADLGYHGN